MIFWLNLIGILLVWLAAATNNNILYWWLLPAALIAGAILEVFIFKDSQVVKALTKIIWILVVILFIYYNPSFIGFYILTAGTILNLAVTAVNNYQMPVDVRGFQNLLLPKGYIAASHNTKLNFLGDRILIPFPSKGSLISLGDILICLGTYTAFIELSVK